MADELHSATEQREFKFLRCPHPVFHTADLLQHALSEEAGAGWMLVEKFDDKRVRLKRPVSARDHDQSLDFDPYRTMTPSMVAELKRLGRRNMRVFGAFMLVGAVIVAIAFIAMDAFS